MFASVLNAFLNLEISPTFTVVISHFQTSVKRWLELG